MENTKYVTICDLRERWLKQQQQQQTQPLEDYDKEEEKERLMPKKYVTILDLREKWLKQQQQQDDEEEEEEARMDISLSDCVAKLEVNKPLLQNPNNNSNNRKPSGNPNLIKDGEGKGGFPENPNWKNNRRPFRRGFHGAGKISEINNEVKIVAEINGGVQLKDQNIARKGEYGKIKSEFGDGLKDAQIVKDDMKKLNAYDKKKLKKKRYYERKRIEALEKRVAVKDGNYESGAGFDGCNVVEVMHITGLVVKEKGNVFENGKLWKKNENVVNDSTQVVQGKTDGDGGCKDALRLRMMKERKRNPERRNVAMGKGTAVLEKKVGECDKINSVDDSIGENVVQVKHTTGLVMGNVMAKNGRMWNKKRVGRIRNGVNDRMEEVEAKMKKVTVTEKRSLAMRKGAGVLEKKVGEIEEINAADGVGDSIVGNVMTENGKLWKKVGRIRNGVIDRMGKIEVKMKEVTVTEKQNLAKEIEVLDKKEDEYEETNADGVDDSIGGNVVGKDHKTGLVMGDVMMKNGTLWKKEVARIQNGVRDRMEATEAKMEVTVTEKQLSVSGTRNVVQGRWIPKSIADKNELQELGKGIRLTEDGNVTKNDECVEGGRNEERLHVRHGDHRTRGNSMRGRWEGGNGGRKMYRNWNEGEGNRDKGLMWVKKSDALDKIN